MFYDIISKTHREHGVWIPIPEHLGELLYKALLVKGAAHKYIKRVPKAGGGYKYFYKIQHGGGVTSEEGFKAGAAFKYKGGHYHVQSVNGDQVTVRHDETGETRTVTTDKLGSLLHAAHAEAISAHAKKLQADYDQAMKTGSTKQAARIKAEAERLGLTLAEVEQRREAGKKSGEARSKEPESKQKLKDQVKPAEKVKALTPEEATGKQTVKDYMKQAEAVPAQKLAATPVPDKVTKTALKKKASEIDDWVLRRNSKAQRFNREHPEIADELRGALNNARNTHVPGQMREAYERLVRAHDKAQEATRGTKTTVETQGDALKLAVEAGDASAARKLMRDGGGFAMRRAAGQLGYTGTADRGAQEHLEQLLAKKKPEPVRAITPEAAMQAGKKSPKLDDEQENKRVDRLIQMRGYGKATSEQLQEVKDRIARGEWSLMSREQGFSESDPEMKPPEASVIDTWAGDMASAAIENMRAAARKHEKNKAERNRPLTWAEEMQTSKKKPEPVRAITPEAAMQAGKVAAGEQLSDKLPLKDRVHDYLSGTDRAVLDSTNAWQDWREGAKAHIRKHITDTKSKTYKYAMQVIDAAGRRYGEGPPDPPNVAPAVSKRYNEVMQSYKKTPATEGHGLQPTREAHRKASAAFDSARYDAEKRTEQHIRDFVKQKTGHDLHPEIFTPHGAYGGFSRGHHGAIASAVINPKKYGESVADIAKDLNRNMQPKAMTGEPDATVTVPKPEELGDLKKFNAGSLNGAVLRAAIDQPADKAVTVGRAVAEHVDNQIKEFNDQKGREIGKLEALIKTQKDYIPMHEQSEKDLRALGRATGVAMPSADEHKKVADQRREHAKRMEKKLAEIKGKKAPSKSELTKKVLDQIAKQGDRESNLVAEIRANHPQLEKTGEAPKHQSVLDTLTDAQKKAGAKPVVRKEHAPASAASRLSKFVSKDPSRSNLMGYHVAKDGRQAVAVDGHRLVVIPLKASEVPPHAYGKIIDPKTDVQIHDTFPDYNRVIPSDSPADIVTMHGTGLKKIADASRKDDLVVFTRHNGEVTAQLLATQEGSPGKVPTGPVLDATNLGSGHKAGGHERVGIKGSYLKDALAGARGPLKVQFTTGTGPVKITRPDGEVHVIMPMRL